jgi:hypothetical protein
LHVASHNDMVHSHVPKHFIFLRPSLFSSASSGAYKDDKTLTT